MPWALLKVKRRKRKTRTKTIAELADLATCIIAFFAS
jgi:hypothetical protein